MRAAAAQDAPSVSRARGFARGDVLGWAAVALSGLLALGLYLSTLQTGVNGYDGAYGTDVGEIQNALPRWGTIHYSGYPLYTATGSLFVTALGALGVPPAASASLWSAVWAAVAVGLLTRIALDLGAPWAAALAGALVAATGHSLWMYASMAHVHTMTLAFTMGAIWLGLRFHRSGRRSDLLWLALVFSQGIAHQRATAALAPALAVLAWPHRETVWRSLAPVVALALLAPLTYLYLAVRAWMGATWLFGSPGTLDGLWTIVRDTKFDRVVVLPQTASDVLAAAERVLGLAAADLPGPLLLAGYVGLALAASKRLAGRWREAVATALAWPPFLVAALFVWEGRVSDALLAVKIPSVAMAGVGLALVAGRAWRQRTELGLVATGVLLAAAGWQVGAQRADVLAIVEDPSAEQVVEIADRAAARAGGAPTTLMAFWGRDYWALAYAQAFEGRLAGLELVDHNADFRAIIGRGERLWVLSHSLHFRSLDWWESTLGAERLYLSQPAEGVVELALAPRTVVERSDGAGLDLGNGVAARGAALEWAGPTTLSLSLYWQVERVPREDFSVAVHLVGHDPPRGPEDLIAQADSAAPVDGWYPTTRWSPGEVVRDEYLVDVPPGARPVALRLAMYRQTEPGRFENTAWLTLLLPERAPR